MGLLPTSPNDQKKLMLGILAVGLAGYYYSYPYAERAEEIETMRAHVEALDAQNAKARAQATRGDVKKLEAEAARTGASLDAMRRLVPTENEVPALLEEISTAARRAGLDISGVTPDPVLAGDEFDTYRYRVTVAGGYHALTTFLANVGSLPRIVAPVGFTLTIAPESPAAKQAAGRASLLSASVTLQAYVAHGAPVTLDAEGAPHVAGAEGAARAESNGEAHP